MRGDHPIWEPEREVDAVLAARLISDQFESLRPVRAAILGSGWDSTAFEVNAEFVFRFPRREIAVPLITTEMRILPRLAPQLTLPIPRPTYLGSPSPAFEWPFAGYRKLNGVPLDQAALGRGDRAALARPLGEFLKRLHAIDPTGMKLPQEGLGKLDFFRRLPQAQQRLETLLHDGIIASGRWQGLLDAPPPTDDNLNPNLSPMVIIHGDLYYRHLLVNESGSLSGVIDWGDICLGRRAIDLMAPWVVLPAPDRQALLAAYGPVDELEWRQARMRALFHTAAVLDYAASTKDETLLREAKLALEFLQED